MPIRKPAETSHRSTSPGSATGTGGHLGKACSISDAERDTGLAKETLRVWEKRYAFPQPLRDAGGERRYPMEQVLKLQLIKNLLDLGHRPGKIIHHSTEQLRLLARHGDARRTTALPAGPGAAAAATAPPRRDAVQADLHISLAFCVNHQMTELRQHLAAAAQRMGLRAFVTDLAAPLTRQVHQAWASAEIALYQEHLYTECLQTVLRNAIFSHSEAHGAMPAGPRILLSALPQEGHVLGLLMATALCTAAGAHCIALGLHIPLRDIVEAARHKQADIVALSYSSLTRQRKVLATLAALHAELPEGTMLWAGGRSPVLRQQPPGYVRVLDLPDLEAAIAEWRQRRGGAMAH